MASEANSENLQPHHPAAAQSGPPASQRISTEYVGGDKITVGDIAGSFNAIGAGAQILVNQALSRAQQLDEQRQLGERLLAQAIETTARRYVQLLDTQTTPLTAGVTARTNPYKPLTAYAIEDAPHFFGRDTAITTMLDLIGRQRLTILHAESGAGKTSLLQAGLAARLLAAGHLPLRIRPYNVYPTLKIKRAFLPDLQDETFASLAQLSLRGFLSRVGDILGDRILCLFLDQFEEFFCELPDAAQQQFAVELAECLDDPGLRVRWVLALRKEYFSDLNVLRPHVANPYAHQYFLETFSTDDAHHVIIAPARSQGVVYEEGLVSHIVADLSSDGRIAPTQIQLVGAALFAQQEAKTITSALYQRLGGAAGILQRHLETVLAQHFDPQLHSKALLVLDALVTSDSRRVVRGEAALAANLAGQPVTSDELHLILAELGNSRLVQFGEDESGTTYELAHDYLAERIELSPEAKGRKAAQELLQRELVNWQDFAELMSPRTLQVVAAQRDFLAPEPAARQLLVASALQTGVDVTGWLAYVRPPEARDALLKALTVADPALQQRAAHHLASFFDEEVATHLAEVARHAPATAVRQAALDTLAQPATALAGEIWRSHLADADPATRQWAATGLAAHLDAQTVALLFERVCQDEATAVWQGALTTLARAAAPLLDNWRPLRQVPFHRQAAIFAFLRSQDVRLPAVERWRMLPARALAYARQELRQRPAWSSIRVLLLIGLYLGLAYWRGWTPFRRWQPVTGPPQVALTTIAAAPDGFFVGSFNYGVGFLDHDGSWSGWRDDSLPRGEPGAFDDAASDVAAIDELTSNPLNPDELFIFIYASGIWHSVDAGVTWAQLDTGEMPTRVTRVSLAAHGRHVLVALQSGLYASDDNGRSWHMLQQQETLPAEHFQFVDFAPTGTPVLGTRDGLYAGSGTFPWQWQRLSDVPPTRYIAFAETDDRLFLALGWPTATATACYQPGAGLGDIIQFGANPITALVAHPTDQDRYYVATSNGQVHEAGCAEARRRSLGRLPGLISIPTDLATYLSADTFLLYQTNTSGFYQRRP